MIEPESSFVYDLLKKKLSSALFLYTFGEA